LRLNQHLTEIGTAATVIERTVMGRRFCTAPVITRHADILRNLLTEDHLILCGCPERVVLYMVIAGVRCNKEIDDII
jgi:hypothetical protein